MKKDGTPRAPKQFEVFSLLLSGRAELSASDINAFVPGAGAAVAALVKKGILVEQGRETYRNPFANRDIQSTEPLPLLPAQQTHLKKSNPPMPEAVCFFTVSRGAERPKLYAGNCERA